MIRPFLYLHSVRSCNPKTSWTRKTYTLILGFDVGNVVIDQVFYAVGDPSYRILNASWNIAVCLVRANGHEHVRKVFHREPEIGFGTVSPNITQGDVIDTTEVYGFKRSGDCSSCQYCATASQPRCLLAENPVA